LVTDGKLRDRISTTNWFAYVIKLNKGKFYIGVAVGVDRRYEQHLLERRSLGNKESIKRKLKIN
jgi:predicted GIY-YIG superfamily endonuclease